MFLILTIFLLTANFAVCIQVEEDPCPAAWTQATWVGMGCLLFNSTATYTAEQAIVYCQQAENSTLVELQTEEQLEFLQMELIALEAHEGTRRWWTSGTDMG